LSVSLVQPDSSTFHLGNEIERKCVGGRSQANSLWPINHKKENVNLNGFNFE